MSKINYTRYGLTSRDLSIIRQHFCNDGIINKLWEYWGTPNWEGTLNSIDKFLNECVKLAMKQPSQKLLEELTKCCDDYPKCSCNQPVAKKGDEPIPTEPF
jgi:hypothetical protein